jgi:hypothetical protein
MKKIPIFLQLIGLTLLGMGASISIICTLPTKMSFWFFFINVAFLYTTAFIKIASQVDFKKLSRVTTIASIIFLFMIIIFWITADRSIPANTYGFISPTINLVFGKQVEGTFANYIIYMTFGFILPTYLGLYGCTLTVAGYFEKKHQTLGLVLWWFNAAVCAFLFVHQIVYICYEGEWMWYLGFYGGLVLVLAIWRYGFSTQENQKIRGHFLNLHRYEWALLLLPFTRYQNLFTIILQGFLLSIFISSAVKVSLGNKKK